MANIQYMAFTDTKPTKKYSNGETALSNLQKSRKLLNAIFEFVLAIINTVKKPVYRSHLLTFCLEKWDETYVWNL